MIEIMQKCLLLYAITCIVIYNLVYAYSIITLGTEIKGKTIETQVLPPETIIKILGLSIAFPFLIGVIALTIGFYFVWIVPSILVGAIRKKFN